MKIIKKLSMLIRPPFCLWMMMLMAMPLPALAFRVEPMSAELASAGPQSKGEIRIENPHDHPITVELVSETRDFDANGKETRTPAEDDFLIFPPQTLVQPGKTQLIRYQYIGDPKISATKAYVINVRQLPIDLKLLTKSLKYAGMHSCGSKWQSGICPEKYRQRSSAPDAKGVTLNGCNP